MRWFKYTFCYSVYSMIKKFLRLYKYSISFLLKWGKIEEDFESSIFLEAQKLKNIILLLNRGLTFFWNGHIRNVVSTLANLNQFNVEIHNVVSKLLNVVNFNVDVHNIVSTLIWRCATSRRHINLKTTLNRRWNACWDVNCIMAFLILFKCVTLNHFYSITSPVLLPWLFTKSNKLWNKRKDNFLYIWSPQCINFIKEVENCTHRHNHIFRHT